MADFKGPIWHTGEWPQEGVDFTGLKVGVIGTGSSAIQSIPLIAEQAKALTVFQRTPNYSVPAWNAPLDPEHVAKVKADYPALRAKARARPTGFYFPFNAKPALEATSEERRRQYEEFWASGGLPFLGAYGDLLFNKQANDTIADFAREKIRGIVKDPATADLLCPDNVVRLQAALRRYRLLRHLQQAACEAGRRFEDADRALHRRGRRRGGHAPSARRRGLRHGVRGHDRLVREDPHHRPWRPDARREMAGRAAHLSRRRLGGLSQPVHDHRAGQPLGAGEHDPGDRAARRLDGRPDGPYARHRRPHLRAQGRGRGPLGRRTSTR